MAVRSDAAARVCERLRQSGELAVILGILADRHELLQKFLLRDLQQILLTDAEALASFHARQGAIAEIGLIIAQLDGLSRGEVIPVGRENTSDRGEDVP
jgi:hypothetical protein